jgi:adenylate cyclase
MNRGAFDFVMKPIDFPDLETTIAKTLRHIELLREAQRRQAAAERAYAALSRYFSPNLAERLASDASAIDLGGQRREIATLFTDIASSPRWRRRSSRRCSARCSTTISSA